nr:alanine aminotransferase 2-like [Danio rerio]|eukprot:XP_005171150.2 alanine aminotransferase 2-like [Danio rerio]
MGVRVSRGTMMSVLQIHRSEKDILQSRAAEIQREIQQGERKIFSEVLDLSSGDLHGGGIKPITFVRQVLAACSYPALLEDQSLPSDVRQRAEDLLRECAGGSVGELLFMCSKYIYI